MPAFALFRALSVASVVALLRFAPYGTTYTAIFLAVLYAHYLLSTVYAARQLTALALDPVRLVPMLLLGALGAWLYWKQPISLEVYFGVHFALTETYVVAKRLAIAPVGPFRGLAALRFLGQLAVYSVLLSLNTGAFLGLSTLVLLSAAVTLTGVAMVLIALGTSRGNAKGLVDALVFEGLGVVVAMASVGSGLTFGLYEVTLYHVVFWLFVAGRETWNVSPRVFGTYVWHTVAALAFFGLLTPQGLVSDPTLNWVRNANLLAYVHITLTFATSKLNPRFIAKWFFPSLGSTPTLRPKPVPGPTG